MDVLIPFLFYVTFGILLYLVLSLAKNIMYPPKPVVREYRPAMMGDLTLAELAKYSGMDPFRPILFAVRGNVYDVTTGRSFYGPGGAYQVFAGKEVARALGKMQINADYCNDDTSDFTEKELKTLQDWQDKFDTKYKVVGKVVPLKELTPAQLATYDGSDPTKPIYLSVRGVVFDVSAGKDYYGPDGAYPFAGKECARAFAKFSTELSDCTDNVEGCTLSEMDALRDWEARFHGKYPVIGKLVK